MRGVGNPDFSRKLALRGPPPTGLARTEAVVVAAALSAESVVLEPDALVDLEAPIDSAEATVATMFFIQPGPPTTA